jgi:hypothetical protein
LIRTDLPRRCRTTADGSILVAFSTHGKYTGAAISGTNPYGIIKPADLYPVRLLKWRGTLRIMSYMETLAADRSTGLEISQWRDIKVLTIVDGKKSNGSKWSRLTKPSSERG